MIFSLSIAALLKFVVISPKKIIILFRLESLHIFKLINFLFAMVNSRQIHSLCGVS